MPTSQGSNRPVRVLVVDDSAAVREAMTQILNADPEIDVMGAASDPFVAARRISEERPDVITLDVEMPKMDGVTFLKKLMSQHPIPVVMCSSLMTEGSGALAAAMEAGAVEAIAKPQMDVRGFLEESAVLIRDAVKGAAKANLSAARRGGARRDADAAARADGPPEKLTADAVLPARAPRAGAEGGADQLVAIGASTGGTEALRVLLEELDAGAPPIVVVQHMPEAFTGPFASRLNSLCRISVREAQDGEIVRRGQALIAPGGRHMLLRRVGSEYRVNVRAGPLVSRHRPSVDVLFRSVAQCAGANAIGIIMTGMGDDGASGLLEMREAGAVTLGQTEESCVVYGMPAAAMRAGAVEREATPLQLAHAINRLCKALAAE